MIIRFLILIFNFIINIFLFDFVRMYLYLLINTFINFIIFFYIFIDIRHIYFHSNLNENGNYYENESYLFSIQIIKAMNYYMIVGTYFDDFRQIYLKVIHLKFYLTFIIILMNLMIR